MTLMGLIVGGCTTPTTPEKDKPKEKPLFEHKVTVSTAPGEADARDPKLHDRTYHIRWERARIDFGAQGIFAGSMEAVAGSMFDRDKPANTFKAEAANADRQSQLLVLTGNVRITSASEKATLRCDKAEWHAKERLIKAYGHVRISGEAGTLSGLNEVWAMPDLNVYGTPDMFKKP